MITKKLDVPNWHLKRGVIFVIAKIGTRLIESLKPKDKPYQVHDAEIRRFFI